MKRMIRANTHEENDAQNEIPAELRKEFDRLWIESDGLSDEFLFQIEEQATPEFYHKYPNYETYAEIYIDSKIGTFGEV